MIDRLLCRVLGNTRRLVHRRRLDDPSTCGRCGERYLG